MSQYDKLDDLLVAAIEARRTPLYARACVDEAARIGRETGRETFRIIDGRLQALRKRGVIVHQTKAEGPGSGGWKVVGAASPCGVALPRGGQQE